MPSRPSTPISMLLNEERVQWNLASPVSSPWHSMTMWPASCPSQSSSSLLLHHLDSSSFPSAARKRKQHVLLGTETHPDGPEMNRARSPSPLAARRIKRTKPVASAASTNESHDHSTSPSSFFAAAPTTSIDLFQIHHEMQQLEHDMRAAFPYNKHGDGRDAYTFLRIRHHLEGIKKCVLLHAFRLLSTAKAYRSVQARLFNQGDEAHLEATASWKVAYLYLNAATLLALRLPEFDDADCNTYKINVLEKLSSVYGLVMELILADDVVPKNAAIFEATAKCLKQAHDAYQDVFAPLVAEFQRRLGWIACDQE